MDVTQWMRGLAAGPAGTALLPFGLCASPPVPVRPGVLRVRYFRMTGVEQGYVVEPALAELTADWPDGRVREYRTLERDEVFLLSPAQARAQRAWSARYMDALAAFLDGAADKGALTALMDDPDNFLRPAYGGTA
jgi:hypothetical protein